MLGNKTAVLLVLTKSLNWIISGVLPPSCGETVELLRPVNVKAETITQEYFRQALSQ